MNSGRSLDGSCQNLTGFQRRKAKGWKTSGFRTAPRRRPIAQVTSKPKAPSADSKTNQHGKCSSGKMRQVATPRLCGDVLAPHRPAIISAALVFRWPLPAKDERGFWYLLAVWALLHRADSTAFGSLPIGSLLSTSNTCQQVQATDFQFKILIFGSSTVSSACRRGSTSANGQPNPIPSANYRSSCPPASTTGKERADRERRSMLGLRDILRSKQIGGRSQQQGCSRQAGRSRRSAVWREL